MKKISLIMAVLMLLGTLCFAIPVSADSDDYYHGTLTTEVYFPRSKADLEYDQYRLPSIIVTKKGTVIIYGEGRYLDRQNDNLGDKNNGDLCEMDLYIRRSTNGGNTFDDPIMIAKGADYLKKGYGETINNPAMFVGNDGRLHLLFTCNVGQGGLWYCYSDDDGVTWTKPVNVKSQIGGPSWSMLACGPGHGICLEDGTLVVSAWTLGGSAGSAVFPLYSKDNGKTWKLGAKASANKDESCIVELSDGSVMINSRQFTGPYNSTYDSRPSNEADAVRRVTVSKNGIDGWSATRKDTTLIDPACQGSIVKVDLEGLPHALLFINNASTTRRDHLTVRCSFDDGATWSKELLLDKGQGGYSDIAVDENGKVYVIYEINAGAKLQFVTFSFYDVFCKDDDTLFTVQNTFENPYTLVTTQKGVKVEKLDGDAMKATVTDSLEAGVTLDVTDVTRRLTADDTPILAMKLKANAATSEKEVKVGLYFRCGSNSTSVGTLYATAMIPNDGEYHTVVFDISSRDALSGNLYSVELYLTPAGQEVAEGDSIEVSAFGFFSSVEEANETYPDTKTATDTTDEEETTNTTEPPKKSGCKSVAGHIGTFAVLTVASGAVLKKKRNH